MGSAKFFKNFFSRLFGSGLGCRFVLLGVGDRWFSFAAFHVTSRTLVQLPTLAKDYYLGRQQPHKEQAEHDRCPVQDGS